MRIDQIKYDNREVRRLAKQTFWKNTNTNTTSESSNSDKEAEFTEDEIASAIPDELTVVLQTITLLKIELDIDKQSIFSRIPVIKMRKSSEDRNAISPGDKNFDLNDTSLSSMNLLCATHLGKLVDVIEK